MEKLNENPEIKPDLSIVIPLYNAEKSISKTLAAIFKNTFKNFEVIVINDGSTDNSLIKMKEYPIIYFSQKNSGASRARNYGAEKARAEILVFIDADIIISDNTLKKIYDTFKENKNVEILGGMPDSLNHYRNKISDYENLYIHYQFQKQENTTNAFYTSLVAIKKNIFKKLNGFDEHIAIIEDMDFGQKLLNAGYTIYLDKSMTFSHLKNFTFSGYIKKQIKKTSGILKIKLRNIRHIFVNKKCYDVSLIFQLGIPIALIIPLCLFFSVIFKSIIFLYFAIVIFLLLIVLNFKMLSYMYLKRNFSFFIAGCFFLLINYWVYAIGLGYGFASFISGKKY